MSDKGTPTAEQAWPSDPEAPGGLANPVALLQTVDEPAAEPADASAAHTSSDAIVAFVLSLISWIACPIVFAVVALIFAMKAEKSFATSDGIVTGSGLNLAAKLIAWINIGFWIAVLVIGGFIGIVLLLAGAGSQPTHP
jgi:hypothetical protein